MFSPSSTMPTISAFGLLLCGGLTSCALATDGAEKQAPESGAPAAAPESVATSAEPITGGAPIGGSPGTVQIEYSITGVGTSWCTGVVIGPHVALTSGHCFDPGLGRSGTSGWVGVKIHYTADGQTWRCVTRDAQTSAGRCLVYDNVWVNRLAPSPPRGDVDITQDFAVLTAQFAFVNVPSYPLLWVEQREDDTIRQYGVGGEGTIMRYYDDRIDWIGDNHMFIEAGTKRNCSGDSGGPWIMTKFGYNWVVGIYGSSDKPDGAACTPVGNKQRAHRLTRARVAWINQILPWVAPYGQPLCTVNATVNGKDAGFYCF
jgi:hypothetical protein